jgi:hypothetical protein
MSVSAIMTACGVIATLLFGGFSLYFTLKKRYPGQITFIKRKTGQSKKSAPRKGFEGPKGFE